MDKITKDHPDVQPWLKGQDIVAEHQMIGGPELLIVAHKPSTIDGYSLYRCFPIGTAGKVAVSVDLQFKSLEEILIHVLNLL